MPRSILRVLCGVDFQCISKGKMGTPPHNAVAFFVCLLWVDSRDGQGGGLKIRRCWFESSSSHYIWRYSQAVKTPGFHPGNCGSTPHSATWDVSSIGRAPALQAGGYRFKSDTLHEILYIMEYESPSRIYGDNFKRHLRI